MGEITDVEEIYSEEYHAKSGERGEKQHPAKQEMAGALHELLQPHTVIDVGCGRGWWMEHWVREQPEVDIIGLDGCADLIKANGQCDESVRELINSCDLRKPGWDALWWEIGPWDLVLCVEVAEHLDERYAKGLVRGLCSLGRTIFFSSARPGQKGVHHVHCRPKRYWIELFADHHFQLRIDLWRAWHEKLAHRGKRYGRNIRRNAMFFSAA